MGNHVVSSILQQLLQNRSLLPLMAEEMQDAEYKNRQGAYWGREDPSSGGGGPVAELTRLPPGRPRGRRRGAAADGADERCFGPFGQKGSGMGNWLTRKQAKELPAPSMFQISGKPVRTKPLARRLESCGVTSG